MARGPQYGYSEAFAAYMYDEESRRNKALRAVAIFRDFTDRPLSEMSCLEVGSATGILAYFLAEHFREVVGIDIDRPALEYSWREYTRANLQCLEMDALAMTFPDDRFDAIVCHHTYEHVIDDRVLVREMLRVLRPGGLLYFGAPNRLMIRESHYGLPFLSWLPPSLSSLYLRLTGKGTHYYERMRTYWGVRRLLRPFRETTDYTLRCILEGARYHSEDVLASYPWLRRLPPRLLGQLVPLAPDLIFVSRK